MVDTFRYEAFLNTLKNSPFLVIMMWISLATGKMTTASDIYKKTKSSVVQTIGLKIRHHYRAVRVIN